MLRPPDAAVFEGAAHRLALRFQPGSELPNQVSASEKWEWTIKGTPVAD
jgi:hypothetical protein